MDKFFIILFFFGLYFTCSGARMKRDMQCNHKKCFCNDRILVCSNSTLFQFPQIKSHTRYSIQMINVKNNHIRDFPENIMERFPKAIIVDVRGNPLTESSCQAIKAISEKVCEQSLNLIDFKVNTSLLIISLEHSYSVKKND